MKPLDRLFARSASTPPPSSSPTDDVPPPALLVEQGGSRLGGGVPAAAVRPASSTPTLATPRPRVPATPGTWRVMSISAHLSAEPGDCLEIGDQVTSIGPSPSRSSKTTAAPADGPFDAEGFATVRLRRDEQIHTLRIHIDREHMPQPRWQHLGVLFPLIFWLMGTAIIIFLRPRDERWLVLVLFSYVDALWLASGLGLGAAAGGGAIVFHIVIWFFLPLAVHLHTAAARTRSPARPLAVPAVPLYAVSAAPGSSTPPAGCCAYASSCRSCSASCCLARPARPAPLPAGLSPAVAVANRIMLYGVRLGFGPFVVFYLDPAASSRSSTIPGGTAARRSALHAGISLVDPADPADGLHLRHLQAPPGRPGVPGQPAARRSTASRRCSSPSTWCPLPRQQPAGRRSTSARWRRSPPRCSSWRRRSLLRDRFQALVDRHVFGIKHSAGRSHRHRLRAHPHRLRPRGPGAGDRGRDPAHPADPPVGPLPVRGRAHRDSLRAGACPPGEPEPHDRRAAGAARPQPALPAAGPAEAGGLAFLGAAGHPARAPGARPSGSG